MAFIINLGRIIITDIKSGRENRKKIIKEILVDHKKDEDEFKTELIQLFDNLEKDK